MRASVHPLDSEQSVLSAGAIFGFSFLDFLFSIFKLSARSMTVAALRDDSPSVLRADPRGLVEMVKWRGGWFAINAGVIR